MNIDPNIWFITIFDANYTLFIVKVYRIYLTRMKAKITSECEPARVEITRETGEISLTWFRKV